MRRILYLIIVSHLSFFTLHAQVNGSDELIQEEIEGQLISAFNQGQYYKCISLLDQLNHCEMLSVSALVSAANSYILLQRYDDCLMFCDYWTERLPEKDKYLFDASYGSCYYYLGQNDLAAFYLGRFISDCDDLDVEVEHNLLFQYSDALFFTLKFQSAKSFYERSFNLLFESEILSWEQLPDHKFREFFGFMLYNYAFCTLFLGDEVNGKRYLELSALCGNPYANTDYKLLTGNSLFAQDKSLKRGLKEEFETFIKKYDVGKEVGDLAATDPMGFWDYVLKHNADHKMLTEEMRKKRKPKSLVSALNDINGGEKKMDRFLYLCNPYESGELENELASAIFGDSRSSIDFRFYPANDMNAFATPYGQVYLTEGILERYHFNKALLLGVCAHEATHYECQHSLIGKWKQLKKERTNAIVGDIAAGVAYGAMAATGIYAASNGSSFDDSYWDNARRLGIYISEDFDRDAFYFKFKYSREQEIASDIIAYRFLESMGIGGYAYIIALQLLGDGNFYVEADEDSDHPTTNYRIMLLKYLYSKDHPRFN